MWRTWPIAMARRRCSPARRFRCGRARSRFSPGRTGQVSRRFCAAWPAGTRLPRGGWSCAGRASTARIAQRSLLAFVPDVPSFYDDLTAGEHIRFVRQANRMSADDDPSERLMALFGLDGHRDQLPSAYSRGMRQKLALVLAFARAPRLLLLDEPYGPLDPDASGVLSGLIEEARSAGAAVLASCHHDVPNLRPDALLRLEDGRLAVLDARDGGEDRMVRNAFGASFGGDDA